MQNQEVLEAVKTLSQQLSMIENSNLNDNGSKDIPNKPKPKPNPLIQAFPWIAFIMLLKEIIEFLILIFGEKDGDGNP